MTKRMIFLLSVLVICAGVLIGAETNLQSTKVIEGLKGQIGRAGTFITFSFENDQSPTDLQIPTWHTGDTVTWEDAPGAAGGDPDQNLYETFAGDTGSSTANTITDTFTLIGGTNVTTTVGTDTCTIDAVGASFTDIDTDYGAETVTSAWSFINSGLGGLTNYDLSVGDTTTPDYGVLRIGASTFGRSSYSNGALDIGGALLINNMGELDVGNDPGIEFLLVEDASNTIRMAIPESGTGNATAMIRSVTIAGPSTLNNNIVTGDTWSTYDTNLDFDTGGSGADLFVQDDLEVEGEIYTHGTILMDADDANQLTITTANITADRTWTFPDDEIANNDLIVGSGAGTFGFTAKGSINLSDFNDDLTHTSTLTAANVTIATGIGSPTIDQVQEYFDNTGSSGYFTGGALSDGGSGTLNVAAGEGFIRTTNDDNAELQSFKWSASSTIAVTDNTTQYVYVDDSGVISLSTSEFLETPDKILIGVVTDEGAAIESVFQLGVRLEESIGQAGRFLRGVHGIVRNKRVGGLIFGQSGDANRDVTMTTGQLEWGRTSYTMSAFDTSGADTFTTYSATGQEDAVASQWPNAQYDNAGTLTTMTNNRWANLFFWLEPNDKIIMVYGRAEFVSQAGAEAEGVPSSSLPTRISDTGLLATRFTFQKSANTATIESAFDSLFANAAVSSHNNLATLAWTSAGHTGTVSTFAGFDGAGAATEYTASNYILAAGDTYTGTHDLGGADDLEIPNSATPTVDTAGQIALDTTITDHDGLIYYYQGAEVMVIPAIPLGDLTTTDGHVIDYNAAGNKFTMDAPAAGGETNSLEVVTTGIATTEIPIGTAPDTVVYAALSGAVTMTNGGVVSMTANSIDSDAYVDGSIDLAHMSSQSVDSDNIVEDTIVNADINSAAAIAGSKIVDATTSVEGSTEYATTAEIDTGTDSTRSMPIDQFVASKHNVARLVFTLVEKATDTATATNIAGDFLSDIAGTILQSDTAPFYLYATNSTAGTTGTMVVDISINGTSIMTTNKLDFDTTEKTTTTAATPPDLTDTTLAIGDIITIDIDAIHTTAAKGLTVYMAIRE